MCMETIKSHKLVFSPKLIEKVKPYLCHLQNLFRVEITVVELPKKDESDLTIMSLDIISENSKLKDKCLEYVSNLKQSSKMTFPTPLHPEIVKMCDEFIVKLIEFNTCVPTEFEEFSGSYGFKFMGSNGNIAIANSFVDRLHQAFNTGKNEPSDLFFKDRKMTQDYEQFMEILNLALKKSPHCLKEISPRFAQYLMELHKSCDVDLLSLEEIYAANSAMLHNEMVDKIKETSLHKRPDLAASGSDLYNAALCDDSTIHAASDSGGHNETDPDSPGSNHLFTTEASLSLSFLDSEEEPILDFDHGSLPKMPNPDKADSAATAHWQDQKGQQNNKAPADKAGDINSLYSDDILRPFFKVHVYDELVLPRKRNIKKVGMRDFSKKFCDHFQISSLDFKVFSDYILNSVYPHYTKEIGYNLNQHAFYKMYFNTPGASTSTVYFDTPSRSTSAVNFNSRYSQSNFRSSYQKNFTPHLRPSPGTLVQQYPTAVFFPSTDVNNYTMAPNNMQTCTRAQPYDQRQLNGAFNNMSLVPQQQPMIIGSPFLSTNQQQDSFASVASKSVVEAARQHQLNLQRSNTTWETRYSANIRFNLPDSVKRLKLPIELAAKNGCDATSVSNEELLEGVVIGCREEEERRRPIVLDASNIAYAHGKGKFSSRGITIAVCYFYHIKKHREIIAYMPQRSYDRIVKEQPILKTLHEIGVLHNTPEVSRSVIHGFSSSCYDDRYLLDSSVQHGGVVVSNDQFADLFQLREYQSNRKKIRTMGFNFIDDRFILPSDPCGRGGQDLHSFLRFSHKEQTEYLIMQKYKPPKREKNLNLGSCQPADNSALGNNSNQQQASVVQQSAPPELLLAQQLTPSITSVQHFPPVSQQQQQASQPEFERHWNRKRRENFLVLKTQHPQHVQIVRDFLNNENYIGLDDVNDLEGFLRDYIQQVLEVQRAE